jgi:cell wall-associated NlpC family hydrolase
MSTLAWLLLLTGMVILRQVYKGRTQYLGEDLSDAFLAITRGDTKELAAVFAREGDADEPMFASLGDALGNATIAGAQASGITASEISKAIGGQIEGLEAKANKSLTIAAVLLGEKAKGYRWAATGPDYYDCSGLMYRAAQKIGYKGGRFTTYTIGTNKAFREVQAPNVQGPGTNGSLGAGIDDIVCWPTHHMGVVTGPDQFYSARNPRSGIGVAKISTFRNGSKPKYYRFVG